MVRIVFICVILTLLSRRNNHGLFTEFFITHTRMILFACSKRNLTLQDELTDPNTEPTQNTRKNSQDNIKPMGAFFTNFSIVH